MDKHIIDLNQARAEEEMKKKMDFLFNHNEGKSTYQKDLHDEELSSRFEKHFARMKRMKKIINWEKKDMDDVK